MKKLLCFVLCMVFLAYPCALASESTDIAPAEEVMDAGQYAGERYLIDCDDLTGWEASYGVRLSLDQNKTEGESSIKMNPTQPLGNGDVSHPIGGKMVYHFDDPVDCTNFCYLYVDVYVGVEGASSEALEIKMGTFEEDGYNHRFPLNNLQPGWHTYQVILDADKWQDAQPDLSCIDTMTFTWFNYNHSHTQEHGQYFLIDKVRLVGWKNYGGPSFLLRGTVLPGETGVSVEGLTVSFGLDQFHTQTDAQGRYVLLGYGDSYSVTVKAKKGVSNKGVQSGKVETGPVIVPPIVLTPYSEPEYLYGDTNLDTFVNSADALMVLQHNVGKRTLAVDLLEFADVYQDGSIDSTDALTILQYSVGLVENLPQRPGGIS